MLGKMDKSKIFLVTHEKAERMEDEHWANALVEEKFEMVLYLRECAYGSNANRGKMEKKVRILFSHDEE